LAKFQGVANNKKNNWGNNNVGAWGWGDPHNNNNNKKKPEITFGVPPNDTNTDTDAHQSSQKKKEKNKIDKNALFITKCVSHVKGLLSELQAKLERFQSEKEVILRSYHKIQVWNCES